MGGSGPKFEPMVSTLLARLASFVLLGLGACRTEAPPLEPAPEAGISPTPPATAAIPTTLGTRAPWVAPHVTLGVTSTDGPKGERPALLFESVGLPALSEDGTTYVYLEEADPFGHVRDTSLCFVDVSTSNTRRALLARRGDSLGGNGPRSELERADRYPTALRRSLEARLVRAEADLARIRWERVPPLESFFAAPTDPGKESADWELVRAEPEAVVSARWNEHGAIEVIRLQPGFEGPPRWTPARVPLCGPTAAKQAPTETLAVTLIGEKLVVLERGWQLGTRDCDGVPSTASFVFVRR